MIVIASIATFLKRKNTVNFPNNVGTWMLSEILVTILGITRQSKQYCLASTILLASVSKTQVKAISGQFWPPSSPLLPPPSCCGRMTH